MAIDTIFIQTDQQQRRKIQKPTEFGMSAMKIPFGISLYSQLIFFFFCSTVIWGEKKETTKKTKTKPKKPSKTESFLSQGSEIRSEIYSVMPRKSLKTDTSVSIPLPATLSNSVCIHLLSLTL